MRKTLQRIIFCQLYILLSSVALPQKADTLFCSDELITMELLSDFSAIQKERTSDPIYHEGELIYSVAGSKKVSLKIKVESRGYFRRDPAHCNFPPLTVNFKKNGVQGTLFENQDKLKLVTPCELDHDVVDEYLIYKMYNKITDQSFKVRLAKVLYYDTGSNKSLFTGYSFFIEHEDEMAARLNSAELKSFITPFDLNRKSFIKLALFEYMVGNKDWYVTSRKNIFVMQPADSTLKPYAIPYDFDLSGFVNAAYAKPEGVPVEYLAKKRIYKGLCFSDEEFTDGFDYFKSIRTQFDITINNMTILPKKLVNYDNSYLDEFYRLTSDFNSIMTEFRKVCETKKLYNLPE